MPGRVKTPPPPSDIHPNEADMLPGLAGPDRQALSVETLEITIYRINLIIYLLIYLIRP